MIYGNDGRMLMLDQEQNALSCPSFRRKPGIQLVGAKPQAQRRGAAQPRVGRPHRARDRATTLATTGLPGLRGTAALP